MTMTTDAMRDAIEVSYRRRLPRGRQYPATVPIGITPQVWFVGIEAEAEAVGLKTFEARYARPAAETLARLAPTGLTSFARLLVQDRPAATVKTPGGAVMRRKREFIVHALGWRYDVPQEG